MLQSQFISKVRQTEIKDSEKKQFQQNMTSTTNREQEVTIALWRQQSHDTKNILRHLLIPFAWPQYGIWKIALLKMNVNKWITTEKNIIKIVNKTNNQN